MAEREPSDVETVTVSPPADLAATKQGLPAAARARRTGVVSQPAAAEPRSSRARARPADDDRGPHVSQQLALAALREEEADHTRTMIRVGRVVGTAALLPLPFLGGAVELRVAMAIAVVVAIAAGFVIERRLGDPRADSERVMVALALSVSPGIFTGMIYFGVFSAAQLFPALALYFFARRESFRSAFALYLLNAAAQAVFALLVITHAIEDPGLFYAARSPAVLGVAHALLQVGFLGAFVLGRGSHRAARDAIEKMQQLMLVAAQRAALLDEARQDLDRALAIDAPGRFTDQVLGEYRLANVIGRGGMGEVYEAFHVGTGDVAAVKLLGARELADPSSVARFFREVRAVRGLASPHVVRVVAAAEDDAPVPFLVMERLRGHDLAHHLRSGKMSPTALDTMLAQVGAAVEEAWAHGIVHRDLKPNNLFLVDTSAAPLWKVLDFGVAALDESSGTLTQGKVVGTPAYMAPEQARGERVDHRADVYALAAIAYRWLTGRPVCSGKDLSAALYQTVHVMPQQPSLLADLPADVDAALALGLVKQPAARLATVAELRAALAGALAGGLDPALRARADAILARHPWGAVRA